MSQKVGCIMIVSGVCIMAALSLKLLIQPFITEDHYVHSYFPSTEIVLGLPILIGFLFFTGFGRNCFGIVYIGFIVLMTHQVLATQLMDFFNTTFGRQDNTELCFTKGNFKNNQV